VAAGAAAGGATTMGGGGGGAVSDRVTASYVLTLPSPVRR
jgi:hypothetical protein